MPTIPKKTILTRTNTSVNVLNVIRNNASVDYRNYIPIATPDADSIRDIGNIIMDYPALQNEFLSALINRIGLVLVTSRYYDNPFARFKRGKLELGETVEEVFVDLAKPFVYDAERAETDQYKREMPDVKSAFHILNSKIFYKTSNSFNDLKSAFLAWDGIYDLISKIIEALYKSMNYDEYQVIKYMIARRLLNGQMSYTTVADPDNNSNLDDILADIKSVSNDFTFLNTSYNPAGVYNNSEKPRQVLLVNSTFDAKLSVQALAYMFNLDKADVESMVYESMVTAVCGEEESKHVAGAKVVVDITGRRETFTVNVNIVLLDMYGNEIDASKIHLDKDSINVTVPIAR